MSNDLLIKINADSKNAEKAFDDIRSKTEDLEGNLKKVALVSGAAFAAFTAEIHFSVKAFEEAQQSSVMLTNALQNQGIFTEEIKKSYEGFADAVQAKTGIDNDAIMKAQALAQGYLGQMEITQELTQAIADLGTKTGSLDDAAEKIGRTIGTGTNAFARMGLQIDETMPRAERMGKVLDFVRAHAGGLAEEMNRADGYSKALSTAFGNFQEAIGERFAPVVAAVRKTFVDFFTYLSESPVLMDVLASFLAAGVAVTGLIAFAAAAVPAFMALSAAAATLGIAMNVAFVGIPILIAAVVAGITFLALNWEKTMTFLKSAAAGAVMLISELFQGLQRVLHGALNLNPDQIMEGLRQIKDSFGKSKDKATETYQAITLENVKEGEKQKDDSKRIADAKEKDQQDHEARLLAIKRASHDLIKMQNEFASQEALALKAKEIDTLKAMDDEKNKADLPLYRQRLKIIQDMQTEVNAQDLEKAAEFERIKAEMKADFAARGMDVDSELQAQKIAELKAQADTELTISRKIQEDQITERMAAHKQMLLDKKQFGASYAIINQELNSKEVTATKSAADGLVGLAQSKNETLKGIGKAASVTQIGIDTAKGAMAVYANFQTAIPYPPVSIPLGLAAAAALTAYGAERISNVMAAADGGLVEGGIPGRDSVPALLMPGELVVPRKNFADVVGAVQGNASPTQDPEVLDVLRRIESKISAGQTTIIQGDVMTDDSYIDSLIRRISDTIQYRNGQIYGVNA